MSSITIGAHSRPAPSRWGQTRKSLTAWRAATVRAVTAAAGRAASLRQIALTVTGLALVDASAFQATTGAGLLVTGGSVLVLEWLTSD